MLTCCKCVNDFLLTDRTDGYIFQACPTVKNRQAWGAASPKKVARINGQAKYILIHHTATSQCANENACASQVKTIQAGHMGGNRNYDDIGYNFLVGTIHKNQYFCFVITNLTATRCFQIYFR